MTRGTLINDQLSTVSGRLLRPRLLAIEPHLVPSSQAVGFARRGSILTAHCSRALVATTDEANMSASALFTDIRSVYYSIIRQYVTGFCGSDPVFRSIAARLSLSTEVTAAALAFVHESNSLLAIGGADPTLPAFLRDLN